MLFALIPFMIGLIHIAVLTVYMYTHALEVFVPENFKVAAIVHSVGGLHNRMSALNDTWMQRLVTLLKCQEVFSSRWVPAVGKLSSKQKHLNVSLSFAVTGLLLWSQMLVCLHSVSFD